MKKIHLKKLLLNAFLLSLFFFTYTNEVAATHFRYGSISWQKTGPLTVQFKVTIAERRSFEGSPNVGDIVVPVTLDLGDGTFMSPNLTITAQNNVEDWIFSEGVISHTYSSVGTYIAQVNTGDRLSTLTNAPDGPFILRTSVNLALSNASPISAFSPIICVPVGVSNNTFFINAVDPDGDPLTFSLNTNTSTTGIPSYPSGLSISSNGLVTFNTTGVSLGNTFAVQVLVSDGKTTIPIDFIIRIVSNTSALPQFDYGVTPANGSTILASVGVPLAINIKANDPDATDIVSLSLVGQPSGTTFGTALPALGNPSTTVLNWTPTAANIGESFIINVVASSGSCESAITSFNIRLESCSPVASVVSPICQGSSIALTASGGTSYEWTGPNGFTSTEQNPTIANALPSMAGTYSVKISGCGSPVDKTVDVAVSPLSAGGTVESALTKLCGPSLVNLTLNGHTGTITGWESQANCTGAWSPIAVTDAALPVTPTASTCYRAIVKNGVCAAATSSVATVLVDMPAVGGKVVLSTNPNIIQSTICPNTNITLRAMGFTGKIIGWQSNLMSSPVWRNIQNDQLTHQVQGTSLSQTTFYRVCICSPLGICTGTKALAYSNVFKVALKAHCTPSPTPSFASKEGVPSAMTLVKAYPIPSNSRITLEIDGSTEGVTHIEILDLTGKVVQRSSQNVLDGFNELTLDMDYLSKGLYLVKVKDSSSQEAVLKVSKM